MFKLVVLLSMAAMAAAKPSVVAYNSVVPAVSSVSQYSSSVLHGSPAVYAAPTVYSAPANYGAGVYGAGVYGAHYATLAQAPHQPAVVLDPVNGVPLDTPEVVAARAAHYTTKALAPFHHLRKRSVGVAPVAYSSVVSPVSYSSPVVSAYSAPYVSHYAAGPVVSAYSSPLIASPYSYSAAYPRALSVHPY